MLGWNSVKGTVDNISLEDVKMFLRQEKFVINEEGEHFAVLQRKGTQLTVNGSKFSLEAALTVEHDNIIIHLRYNTFVLFDTGDLKKELDVLISKLKAKQEMGIDPLMVFKALGDEKRLMAIKLLLEEPLHNQELASKVGLKPTTMSHHMSKLMDAGLVSVKQGDHNKSIYTVDESYLKKLLCDIVENIKK